jgi:hypothetical protein
VAVVASTGALALGLGVAFSSSLALFAGGTSTTGTLGTKAIFPGERVTPAFQVGDASAGGAPIDRSSELAFGADGRTLATTPWSTVFTAARYLEFDLNASLPGALDVSTATFEVRFSSVSAASTTCFYFEVRVRSTDALLGTYGSSGSPIDCVTGTTLMLSTTSIASSISSTDQLNDLRIRLLGRDSGGHGMDLDRATVSGTTPHVPYTLYTTRFVDAADTTPSATSWALALP